MEVIDQDDYDYILKKGKFSIPDFKHMLVEEMKIIKKNSELLNMDNQKRVVKTKKSVKFSKSK